MKTTVALLKTTLVLAAFGLITNGTSMGQSVNAAAITKKIRIDSLPFNITAPGTYVLTGNLTSPLTSYGLGAINISTPIAGRVVLDLNGFTLTGNGVFSTGVTVAYNAPSGNTDSITIRNGTLTNFGYGVVAFGGNTGLLSDITVDHIVFNPSPVITGNGGSGVKFVYVTSSTVDNCIFNGAYQGVQDWNLEGNSYKNDTFNNCGYALAFAQIPATIVLDRCQFIPPPTQ
jgi:hypothetical protein